MSQPVELPWKVTVDDVKFIRIHRADLPDNFNFAEVYSEDGVGVDGFEGAVATAKFMVHAANCHGVMLEALKEIRYISKRSGVRREFRDINKYCDDAIAEADGKS